MTQDTAIVKQNGKSGESLTLVKARDLASRLKYLIVNGQKLQDQEVFALAQYSAANDLNPFAGEAYYIPGTGPCPGIAGWRKKAQEQLDWEAAKENTQAHMWGQDRAATVDEVKHDPQAGDIAVIYTLHEWLSNTRWRKAYFETIRELKALNFSDEEARATAKDMVGPEPTWSGIGIVYGSENFGKSDKMSRYERAAKRAEKLALRKRFPRVNLPEPSGVDADAIDVEYQDTVMQEPERPQLTEQQIMNDLGFGDMPVSTSAPKVEDPEKQPNLLGEQMPGLDPYADLKAKADTDPKTASRMLAGRIGWNAKEVEALSIENKGDWGKTFAALLRNAPPA